MERCPNCGNKLSNIDVLCPRCGTVVEVIQIKSSIATDSGAAAGDGNIKKKDSPQSFIAYNKSVSSGTNDRETRSETPASSPAPAADSVESSGVDPTSGQAVLRRYKGLSESDEASDIRADKTGVTGNEDESDYSPRYLENLMNMKLPEIDDLQNFDPDEFMREYRRSKRASEPAEEEAPQPAKRWLEIEEPDASAEAEPAESLLETSEEPVPEPVEERRYRGMAEQLVEKQEERPVKPPRVLKRKKSGVMVSVLLWVLVTAALFFCFIFFDKYVQKAYGNYDNLIYSITNGQIDLGPQS
jgi:hypothetical protein